jgi:signal transduction histidine kinase
MEEYRAQSEAKGLAMTSELSWPCPAVRSDPGRVAQILGNLLSNAIKYTASGLIAVRLLPRRDARGRECAAVDVIDTGPGIPAEYQERIFDEFQRASLTERTSGSGIGLAISQRLAELLDGGLTVTSTPSVGSAFTLWLPLPPAAGPGPPSQPPHS